MEKFINRKIILIVVLALIAGAIYYLNSRKVDVSNTDIQNSEIERGAVDESAEERINNKEKKFERAKEITTPDAYINTPEEGIKISDLIGEKVILVDFWTYSCINCQRTLPHLNSWYESYEDDGLVIIGVHTPEFEFEKDLENVQRAVEKFNIGYPVVLDNDYSTWRSYNNRYWPRKYLIDIDGFIVYDHIGEGSYDETESEILKALEERKKVLALEDEIEISSNQNPSEEDLSQIRTPEIYFGSSRLEYMNNLPSKMCLGITCNYEIDEEISPNRFVLGGRWRIDKEEAVLVDDSGEIQLNFNAKSVNIVAGSEDENIELKVYLDGKLLGDDNSGQDVSDSKVSVSEYGLYNLLELGEGGEHNLRIEITGKGFKAFTFTFG